MEQVLHGGWSQELDDTLTEYNTLIGGKAQGVAEANYMQLVSTDGVIKNLRVRLAAAPGEGKSYDLTLMLNGNPTALTVHIHDTDTTGSNTADEIDVTGGDYVSLQCVPTGTPTAVLAYWSSMFEGDTAKESVILGAWGSALNSAATEYGHIMCSGDYGDDDETRHRSVVPTAGTIKNFYVKLTEAPGNSGAYKFTLRKGNGAMANTALTVTITDPATTGNDTVNEVAVVAGDILTMMVEPIDSPSATPNPCWGMTFVADIDGESIVLHGSTNLLSPTSTEFNYIIGYGSISWYIVSTDRALLSQACTIKKLYFLLSAAPSVGDSYTFSLSIIGDSNIVTLTISDTDTTGNSGELTDIVADDDLLCLKVVPTSDPDVAYASWGFVSYIEPPPPPAPTVVSSGISGNRETQRGSILTNAGTERPGILRNTESPGGSIYSNVESQRSSMRSNQA